MPNDFQKAQTAYQRATDMLKSGEATLDEINAVIGSRTPFQSYADMAQIFDPQAPQPSGGLYSHPEPAPMVAGEIARQQAGLGAGFPVRGTAPAVQQRQEQVRGEIQQAQGVNREQQILVRAEALLSSGEASLAEVNAALKGKTRFDSFEALLKEYAPSMPETFLRQVARWAPTGMVLQFTESEADEARRRRGSKAHPTASKVGTGVGLMADWLFPLPGTTEMRAGQLATKGAKAAVKAPMQPARTGRAVARVGGRADEAVDPLIKRGYADVVQQELIGGVTASAGTTAKAAREGAEFLKSSPLDIKIALATKQSLEKSVYLRHAATAMQELVEEGGKEAAKKLLSIASRKRITEAFGKEIADKMFRDLKRLVAGELLKKGLGWGAMLGGGMEGARRIGGGMLDFVELGE